MDSWKVAVVIVVMAVLQIIILPLLIPTSHLVNTFNQERQQIAHWFGYERTTQMINTSEENFNVLFVDTGVVSELHEWLTHDRQKDYKNTGINEISEHPMFPVIEEKLNNIWLMVKSGMLRIEMVLICILLNLWFLVPSIVDGLVVRERLRDGSENVSTIFYHQSQKIFTACLLLPVLALFWPIAMSPIYFVVWTFLLAGSCWLMCQNLQLKI